MSFPKDKCCAKGAKAAPPDTLAEVGVTLLSGEVVLLL